MLEGYDTTKRKINNITIINKQILHFTYIGNYKNYLQQVCATNNKDLGRIYIIPNA